MIRRLIPLFVTVAVVGAFIWTLVYLHKKSQARPVVYETTLAEHRDITRKAVAPGALVPRREVAIKPRVSGVVQKIYVEPGQHVKRQALLAKIQIVPDVVRLNQAEASLRAAELGHANAKTELARYEQLHKQGLVSEADLSQQSYLMELRTQELEAAQSNLQLVRVGASKRSGKASNLVHSTVEGMVLQVPAEEGASVIEANNFNEGTTIASIADMNDIVFEGRIDESDVGGLKENMPVSITVGALDDQRFEGTLEYVSPKGLEKEGTIEFEIRASVKLKAGTFIRANYSANADVILEQRTNVLAINEGWIDYEGGKAYVEVEKAPQQFERRQVQLGVSDGIWVEVKGGLDAKARIKKPTAEVASTARKGSGH